jgi:hypothetical protein
MKKNILLTAAALSAASLLFSGCQASKRMHDDAEASVDIATGNYKGDSRFATHQKPNVNVGWLITETFLTSGGSFATGSGFDQTDSQDGLPAGGPSDGTKQGGYHFMLRPAVAVPSGYFTLSEELELVGKGFKTTDDAGSETDDLYYLELPVLVNYNMKISGGNEFRIGLGPYAAAGIFGHYSGLYSGMHTSGSIKFGPNADYNRMDYGLVLNAGYMITPKISASLNYDLGLRNIYSADDKIFNRSFGLSVGYRIK